MTEEIDKITKGAGVTISQTPAPTQEGNPKAKEKEPFRINGKTKEELEAETAALALEEKKLALEFQKAQLVDMRERLDEREMKRANHRQEAYTKGATLKDAARKDEATQERCNHKKGGNGAQGVVGGQGDDSQYAVWKHVFANGDMVVGCLRCHKKWKHPVKSDYIIDGKFKENEYQFALRQYKEAVGFQTRNSTSKAVLFQYSDGGEFYRENTKNVK